MERSLSTILNTTSRNLKLLGKGLGTGCCLLASFCYAQDELPVSSLAATALQEKAWTGSLEPARNNDLTVDPHRFAPNLDWDDERYLVAYGHQIGQQSRLDTLGLSNDETQVVLIGILLAAQKQPCPYEGIQDQQLQSYLQSKAFMHQQKQSTQASHTNSGGQDYFERLCQENPEVQKTASGLHYRVLDPTDTTGQYPGPQDNVLIEYQGELTDGTVFDATRPGSPIWLPMNGVIAGFQEGLQLAQKGQTLILYIPPQLGYGSMAIGKIPAHSTLVFKIKLIDIRPNLKQP